MKNTQGKALLALLAVWFSLMATGCSRGTCSKLCGTWVKKNGDPSLPELITLRQADHRFKMSHFQDGGLETTTLLCDGVEHSFSAFPVKMTYSAEVNGSTLTVNKRIKSIFGSPIAEVAYTEEWSANEDGSKLSVVVRGTETTFERRPFSASLFSGSP